LALTRNDQRANRSRQHASNSRIRRTSMPPEAASAFAQLRNNTMHPIDHRIRVATRKHNAEQGRVVEDFIDQF
jgi:hypothetical protein